MRRIFQRRRKRSSTRGKGGGEEGGCPEMDAAAPPGHLEKHLRVHTFPLGIKSYKAGEPLPDKAKVPSKHLGIKVAICQAISIARRYGWSMAVSGADISSPIAKAAFGFEERNEYYTSGKLAHGVYASC